LPWQYLAPGDRLTINIRAVDPEYPEQTLTYSYAPVLEGTAINQSGLFRWIAPTNQPPGDYAFHLQVTDNGLPPRSGTGILNFTITGGSIANPNAPIPPVIETIFAPGGQAPFTIPTIPGQTYRVEYTDNLGAPVWQQLDRDFVAGNPSASLTDSLSSSQRFYRVILLQ